MSYDEHTCDVGIATRVEAFADILMERRKKTAHSTLAGRG
jgi:predicted nucleotide-binding protein (sugar kinase/HSP70/actin superfamily)